MDLLNDVYEEGLTDNGKAFETKRSKRLKVKESMKVEQLQQMMDIFNELKPSESVLESSYALITLKCMEIRRKLLYVLNAIRSVERRITYSMLTVCKILQEDINFLVSLLPPSPSP